MDDVTDLFNNIGEIQVGTFLAVWFLCQLTPFIISKLRDLNVWMCRGNLIYCGLERGSQCECG